MSYTMLSMVELSIYVLIAETRIHLTVSHSASVAITDEFRRSTQETYLARND